VLQTRFIFVEGIVGSGKTSTAEFLTARLLQCGIETRFLPEGPTIEAPEHPLRVATTLPHPGAVWRDITVAAFIDLSLSMWENYVHEARQPAAVTICDGLLFHGNLTDLYLMDASELALQHYADRILATLSDLDPVIVYLRPVNVARTLRTASEERGSSWESYQVMWKTRSPYGQRHSLNGFDGLVTLYQSYRTICDNIFWRLARPKLLVSDDIDWNGRYAQILDFLGVE
jgi:hypothetical protein